MPKRRKLLQRVVRMDIATRRFALALLLISAIVPVVSVSRTAAQSAEVKVTACAAGTDAYRGTLSFRRYDSTEDSDPYANPEHAIIRNIIEAYTNDPPSSTDMRRDRTAFGDCLFGNHWVLFEYVAIEDVKCDANDSPIVTFIQTSRGFFTDHDFPSNADFTCRFDRAAMKKVAPVPGAADLKLIGFWPAHQRENVAFELRKCRIVP